MAKTDKPPKKKVRLAAIETRLMELQEQLRELDRKLDAHALPHEHSHHAQGADRDEDVPHHTHAELNERLVCLETKLDTLIAGLAQVEAGPALRGESQPHPEDDAEKLES